MQQRFLYQRTLSLAAFVVLLVAGQQAIGQIASGQEANSQQGNEPPASSLAPVTPPSAVQQKEQQRIEAMARATAPTVAVFGNGGEGGGSGVIISADGYTLTNYHVSSPFGTRMRCGLSDGKIYDAVIVGVDPVGDVAMLKLLGREDFPTAVFGDSNLVKAGDWCFAIGNPFLLATNLQPSVSYGIVSGVNRYQYPAGTILEYTDCIQTDAAINPGNSGGPLFNAQGELIGINGRASFEKRGRVNVGVGYAISINQVKNFMGHLRSGRFLDHSTLGATVATGEDGKVRVSNILDESDAYRRGLRYGDEIIEVAGRPILSANELKNLLGVFPKDWRVPLRYRNDEGEVTTLVRLQGVHSDEELLEIVRGGMPGTSPTPPPQDKEDPKPEDDGKSPNKELQKKDEGLEGLQESEIAAKQAQEKLITSMIDPKEGFSNYFFNKLEQDRIWGSYAKIASPMAPNPIWQLNGKLAGEETRLTIRLSDDSYDLSLEDLKEKVDPKRNLSAVIHRRNRLGLALGLGVWKKLIQEDPRKLGTCVYVGSMPLEGKWPLRNLINVGLGELRVVALHHPESHVLEAIEVYGDEEDDPIEVYFDAYQEIDGKTIPKRIRLQYGIEPEIIMDVEAFTSEQAPTTTEPAVQ